MPGIPKVEMATVSDFFRRATEKLDEFPVWDDELFLDGHRGTYTTHADAKKNNRRSELALRETEMAAWMREKELGIPYPAEAMEKLWKMILPMQFHDTLPGTCITQAYEDCAKAYDAFFREQQALMNEILTLITATQHADEYGDLVVTETDPGFAGNTATNVTKPATVETGAEIKVPLFINEGDKIQIDTRTGEYLGRSKA